MELGVFVGDLHFGDFGGSGRPDADEFFVCAAFDDAAVVEDDDEVGAAEGGEAVSNDEGGAAVHGAFHGGHDFLLGVGVDGGGGVVEDEDGGLEDDGAGESEALALAAGEGGALLADDGFISVREFHDEVVGLGDFSGFFELFAGSAGGAEGDVGGDGVGEEEGFLEDQADGAAEVVELEGAGVVAVDEEVAGGGVVKAGDEGEEGGFAGTGSAEDGDDFAGLGGEGEVGKDRFTRAVTEGDVLEFHRARATGRGWRGVGRGFPAGL